MAGSALVPVPTELFDVWQQFQSLAEARVLEGNIVAGERLWEVVKSADLGGVLIIQSTRRPANSVKCSVNARERLLTCQSGSAFGQPVLAFYVRGGSTVQLCCGQGEFTLHEALSQVLDQLVWTEESGIESR